MTVQLRPRQRRLGGRLRWQPGQRTWQAGWTRRAARLPRPARRAARPPGQPTLELPPRHRRVIPAVADERSLTVHAAVPRCLGTVPVLPACAAPGSWFTETSRSKRGLTAPPQAFRLSAPLAASFSRLTAALTSRPRTRPQRPLLRRRRVQREPVRLYHPHPLTTRRPARGALSVRALLLGPRWPGLAPTRSV